MVEFPNVPLWTPTVFVKSLCVRELSAAAQQAILWQRKAAQ
jgi:hypothetical protein